MGNTAKFMLVGVLSMVIVIAVIWDRQGSELETAAVPNGTGNSGEVPSPTLTDGATQAQGIIHLVPGPEAAQDEALAAMREEMLRSLRPVAQDSQPGPAEAQAAAAQPPKVKTYIVKEGESFWTIAEKTYRDANLWEKLWQANIKRYPKPELLRAGDTIILPEIENTRVALTQGSTPAGAVDSSGNRHYTVKEGDCLGIISQKFYGTSKKWRLILDANDLEDETSLRAGMKIVIPPDTN